MAEQNPGAVLVIGAGVGGIKASIDLAERGCRVILAESSPALGGILSQLDYQFPNNHCGLCRMLPAWERDAASDYCMRKGLFHENIRILPMTELAGLEGEAGRLTRDAASAAGGSRKRARWRRRTASTRAWPLARRSTARSPTTSPSPT